MELTPKQQRIKAAYDQLRPYQREVFHNMVVHRRWLNYMRMGMGKTLVTALAAEYIGGIWIVVCTKSAMYVWEEELRKWFDEEAVIYAGKPKQREEAFRYFAKKGLQFIITNYALCAELCNRFGLDVGNSRERSSKRGTISAKATTPTGTQRWEIQGVIGDEIQRAGLFNHTTVTYSMFKKLSGVVPCMFLLTGTPYRRGVVDFFGPLSLKAPQEFKSYWSFVSKYCVKINTGFGVEIDRNPKDVVAFRAMLRKHASILNKEDYLQELPGKQRQLVPIDMDDEQRRVYEELSEELFAMTDSGELIITPSVLSLLTRQRQLLVAPQILGLTTRGAAINTLVEMAEDLIENNKPFVVFTPFRKAVHWISEALKEKFKGLQIFAITGGLNSEEFRDQWQGFQNGSGKRVLICVISSGASFHATVADTCFFIGYEWDFNLNEQAEDRLYRIGQKNFVVCYYLMYRNTVDDLIRQKLNDKKYGADLILSNEEVFKMMLKKREQ